MPQPKSKKQDATNPLMQRLIREGSLICYFLLALFLLIALISYSPSDPAFFNTGVGSDVENSVGVYGAYISDILFQLLGHLAYAVPLILIYKIYSAFKEAALEEEFSASVFAFQCLGFSLLIFSACGLSAIHFTVSTDLPYLSGGVIGALLVEASIPALAVLGSTLVFFSVFLFGLTITFNISWLEVVDKIGLWSIKAWMILITKLQKWVEYRKQKFQTKARLETRKKELDIHMEKEKKRIPPTIKEIPKKPINKSIRVEKERQGRLFEATSSRELPAIGLLDAWQETNKSGFSKESLSAMSKLLELKLKDFGIDIEVIAVNPGPVITRF